MKGPFPLKMIISSSNSRWLSTMFLAGFFSPLGSSQNLIENLVLSKVTFNPSNGESIALSMTVADGVNVVVLDVMAPDRSVVRRLGSLARVPKSQNRFTVSWDGKDDQGRVVPNEAYYFRVTADTKGGAQKVIDPVEFSGGEFGDVSTGSISRRSGTISYRLSQPSRVLIRAGIPGSALLKTIVDWEPRDAGSVTDYWNGKDEDNLIDVFGQKEHRVIVSYYTLPANSVIARGNSKVTFAEYQRTRRNRSQLPYPEFSNGRKVSPHFRKDRTFDRSFRVKVEFPDLDPRAAVITSGAPKLIIRLDVDEQDRRLLLSQQYEVILFVDGIFYAEEERGYLPFRYPFEISSLSVGDHVITANIITFGDQVGIGSRKIKVVR